MNILETNAFDLLSIPISFNINIDTLKVNYLILQKKFHPDKTNNSENIATYINNSYNILKDPLQRAELILELNSINKSDAQLSIDFINKQIEYYEEFEELKLAKDINQLADFEKSMQKQQIDVIKQIATEFDRSNYETIRVLTKQLSFYNKFIQRIAHSIDEY